MVGEYSLTYSRIITCANGKPNPKNNQMHCQRKAVSQVIKPENRRFSGLSQVSRSRSAS